MLSSRAECNTGFGGRMAPAVFALLHGVQLISLKALGLIYHAVAQRYTALYLNGMFLLLFFLYPQNLSFLLG